MVVAANLGSWVYWGINPTNTDMVGAQVLAAYKATATGVITVKMLDLKSYFVVSVFVFFYSCHCSFSDLCFFKIIILPNSI